MSLRILSKFSHITKCKIEPVHQTLQEESIKSMMKVFQRAFKLLKRTKKLVAHLPGKVQAGAHAFKTLLLLNNLASLALPEFSYSEDDENMKLFLETVKSASKRRSWPHLESLNIQLQPPSTWSSSPEYDGLYTRSLKQPLEFMKSLRRCQKVYECSSFELKLAPLATMNLEQADLLNEIAKIAPLIASIREFEIKHFQGLSKMVEDLKGLKAVELVSYGSPQPDIDLSVLRQLSSFQELTLNGVLFKKQLLRQIQGLENLTVLSLSFRETPDASSSEALDLAGTISDLTNLKALGLEFKNIRSFTYSPKKIKLENCP